MVPEFLELSSEFYKPSVGFQTQVSGAQVRYQASYLVFTSFSRSI